MKQKFLILLSTFFLFTNFSVDAQISKKRKANKDTENWRYESQCNGEGVQGTYTLKVWSYSKKPIVAIEQAKKNAVHAVVFQGISGAKCTTKGPLLRDPILDDRKKDFFKAFFKTGGDYLKFAPNSTDASGPEVLKLSRKEYKIGVNVQVNVALLRKHLEKSGIILGLGSRF